MQTEHAELGVMQPSLSPDQAEMFQLDDPLVQLPPAVQLRRSRLSSETRLMDLADREVGSELGIQLPPLLAADSPGASAENMFTEQRASLRMPGQTDSQACVVSLDHVRAMCCEGSSPSDTTCGEGEVCAHGTSLKAAAAAALLLRQTASLSPCYALPLPAALSQGITSSPVLQNGDDESTRRRSFSPLQTGPVSILPLVENPETGLPSISCQTLAQLLSGQHSSQLTTLKIVDCR